MYRKSDKIKIAFHVLMPLFFIFLFSGTAFSQEVIADKGEKNRKLTLEECIEIAAKNHIPLTIAKKQLRLAELRLLEARRNLGPTLTAKWEETAGKVDGRHYEGTKIAVEGKQPIFYGGELVFSVRQAEANLEVVKIDYDRVRNELVLQVKKAYYGLDKSQKALKIQEDLYRETKRLYEITKAGYGANIIPHIEFLKVDAQYNQVNFQVISSKEDIAVSNIILQQAMGIDEEIDIVELEEPEITEIDLDSCYELAYINRPELKIGQLSKDYFEYEKKITRARAGWPRIDLLASYGRTVEQFVKGDRSPTDHKRGMNPEYYVGTQVSLPFWGNTLGYSYTKERWAPVVRTVHGTDATTNTVSLSLLDKLRDIAGYHESDLEYIRSEESLRTKRQEITLEVKEMFFRYKKAIILMDVTRSKIEFQTKQVQLLDVKLQHGAALFSDVIEEMIKLAEEKFSYIQVISDYYLAIASLNKAIGVEGYFRD